MNPISQESRANKKATLPPGSPVRSGMVPLSRERKVTPACPIPPVAQCVVDPTGLAHYTKLLKALAHPIRLEMLQLMGSREVCVCEFEQHFTIKQPTISHHLKLLKEAGILHSEQRGYWVYYGVNPEAEAALNNLPLKLGWSQRSEKV